MKTFRNSDCKRSASEGSLEKDTTAQTVCQRFKDLRAKAAAYSSTFHSVFHPLRTNLPPVFALTHILHNSSVTLNTHTLLTRCMCVVKLHNGKSINCTHTKWSYIWTNYPINMLNPSVCWYTELPLSMWIHIFRDHTWADKMVCSFIKNKHNINTTVIDENVWFSDDNCNPMKHNINLKPCARKILLIKD